MSDTRNSLFGKSKFLKKHPLWFLRMLIVFFTTNCSCWMYENCCRVIMDALKGVLCYDLSHLYAVIQGILSSCTELWEQFHQSFIRLTGKHVQTLVFYWCSFDMACPVCLASPAYRQLRDLAMLLPLWPSPRSAGCTAALVHSRAAQGQA